MRGFSQEELGEKLGVTRQTIASWEEEKTIPDIMTGIEIAKILHVELEDLTNPDEKNILKGPPICQFLGTVRVEKDGKIQLPRRAMRDLEVRPGDQMLIVSDTERGIELLPMNVLWENMLEKYCDKQS